MNDPAHEKRIKNVEAECVEIKKQILQLEFQHKKDIAEFDRRSQIRAEERERRTEERERIWKEIEKQSERTEKHLRHLSKLTGIAFEERRRNR